MFSLSLFRSKRANLRKVNPLNLIVLWQMKLKLLSNTASAAK